MHLFPYSAIVHTRNLKIVAKAAFDRASGETSTNQARSITILEATCSCRFKLGAPGGN